MITMERVANASNLAHTLQKLTVYVDNQAVLKATGMYITKSRMLSTWKSAIRELMSQEKVRLCWVPGDCDITKLAGIESALDISDCVRSIKPLLGYFFGKKIK